VDEVEGWVEDPWLFDVVDAKLEDISVWNVSGRRMGRRGRWMRVEEKGRIEDKGCDDMRRRGAGHTSTFGDVHFGWIGERSIPIT
jgi:hypothetical protein